MRRQLAGVVWVGKRVVYFSSETLKDTFSERERLDVLIFGIASSDEYSEPCECRGSSKLAVPAVFAVF